MASDLEKYHVLVVEDSGEDRDLLRRLLKTSSKDDVEFIVRYWGEGINEPFDPEIIAQWILDHNDEYHAVLLDFTLNQAEEAELRKNYQMTREQIAKLEPSRCPSGVRILRQLLGRNTIPLTAWTWHESDPWTDYVVRDLHATWAMPKRPREMKSLKEHLRWMCKPQKVADLDTLRGGSFAMGELKARIRRHVHLDIAQDVHIFGPIGSGKELVATVLGSALRPGRPFVRVNCATLDPQLALSQLFGHVKGAFTGAIGDHPGFFEQANMGVLFLDEVQDLPPSVRPQLLRALEQKAIVVTGKVDEMKLDVLVISASSENLAELARQGEFPINLHSRLCRTLLTVPSLNERREDILSLAEHFLGTVATPGTPYLRFDREAVQKLQNHDWALGNCRALMNCVTTLAAKASSPVITARDVEEALGTALPTPPSETLGLAFQFPPLEPNCVIKVREEMGRIRTFAREHFRQRATEALMLCDDEVDAQKMLSVTPKYWYDNLNRDGGDD